MSLYVKSFGIQGTNPANIWVNKNLNKICEWKNKEIVKGDGSKYNKQFAFFSLKTSFYKGKDNNGKIVRLNSNDISVFITDKNIFQMFEDMQLENVDYYSFYGNIVIKGYEILNYIAKDKDGKAIKDKNGNDIIKQAIKTEIGELNDFNFKIIPHYLSSSSTSNIDIVEAEPISVKESNCEDEDIDEIPF